MRLWCVLVLGCLMAASAVRPLEIERHDPQAPQLDVAPSSRVLVARRQAPHLPDLRIPPVVVAAAPAVTAPPLMPVSQVLSSSSPIDACAPDTACARGPPIA